MRPMTLSSNVNPRTSNRTLTYEIFSKHLYLNLAVPLSIPKVEREAENEN